MSSPLASFVTFYNSFNFSDAQLSHLQNKWYSHSILPHSIASRLKNMNVKCLTQWLVHMNNSVNDISSNSCNNSSRIIILDSRIIDIQTQNRPQGWVYLSLSFKTEDNWSVERWDDTHLFIGKLSKNHYSSLHTCQIQHSYSKITRGWCSWIC